MKVKAKNEPKSKLKTIIFLHLSSSQICPTLTAIPKRDLMANSSLSSSMSNLIETDRNLP